MDRETLDHFFQEISRTVKGPTRVYLTGGTVSYPWGGNRPPEGATFGLHCTGPAAWDLQNDIEAAGETSGMPVALKGMPGLFEKAYLPDYKKGATLYKRFGRLSVYLLDWKVWSIGKLGRGELADLRDLKVVLQKVRPSPIEALKVWAQALKGGIMPAHSTAFVRAVENFFRQFGREIWGGHLEPERILEGFRKRAAEIARNQPQALPRVPVGSTPFFGSQQPKQNY
jgi:hypothetical protein